MALYFSVGGVGLGVQVLMFNSYKCYKHYHEMKGLETMSHYKYQSKIACAWLNKDYSDEAKTSGIPRATDVSGLTIMSTTNTVDMQRERRISERSIHPLDGTLKHRLSTFLRHYATTSNNAQHYYQLHYWTMAICKYHNVKML